MKIRPTGALFFQADGYTDRHDEANGRFFFSFAKALNKKAMLVAETCS